MMPGQKQIAQECRVAFAVRSYAGLHIQFILSIFRLLLLH